MLNQYGQYGEIAAGFRYSAVAAGFRCSFQRLNQYCQYSEIAAGFRYGAVAAGSDHNHKTSALLNSIYLYAFSKLTTF